MARNGKLPVLNLLTGQKSGFFASQVQLVAQINVKLDRADGYVGPLGCANFTSIATGGWECGPEISKMSTFW